MSAPVRIQRMRTKGWTLPPDTVIVTRPTEFGNPFVVGDYCRLDDSPAGFERKYAPAPGFAFLSDATAVVEFFRAYRRHRPYTAEQIERLRGKNLACFCALDRPCHAGVLLEIANP